MVRRLASLFGFIAAGASVSAEGTAPSLDLLLAHPVDPPQVPAVLRLRDLAEIDGQASSLSESELRQLEFLLAQMAGPDPEPAAAPARP